jgi:hypothetical protein
MYGVGTLGFLHKCRFGMIEWRENTATEPLYSKSQSTGITSYVLIRERVEPKGRWYHILLISDTSGGCAGSGGATKDKVDRW